MAIFIIDQFSLNTDLPLDIRYVPAAGRLDPDISVYKYPGMQVFDTNTESIWYADNSLNWVEVGSGSDASLNALYQTVIDLSTYISNNVDASIVDLQGDIARIDLSIGNIDISLGVLNLWNISQDASIEALRADHTAIDASIVDLRGDITNLETSVGVLDGLIQTNIVDISNLETSVGTLDGLIQTNITDISNLESSVNTLDGLIQTNIVDISNLETSVGVLDGLIQTNITDISNLETSVGVLDGLIQTNITDISNLETSVGALDILTQIHDNSIGAIEASLGDYVKKAGDTMTGPLTITGGGLQIGTIGSPQDVSIYSNLYVHENTVIGGNLTVDGSLYIINKETLDVSAAFIHLNTGLTGTPPASMQSGIEIGRGDLDPYVFIFDESNQTFRIGIASETSTGYLDSSTQAVATREDTPTVDGVAVWNSTELRFDTHTGLTYDGDQLTVDTSLVLPSLAGGSELMLTILPNGQVSTQVIQNSDASINNLYQYIDGSLATRDASIAENATNINVLQGDIVQIEASIANIETSLGVLNIWNVQQDASIVRIDGELGQLDASIIRIDTELGQIDASLIRIDGSINNIYTELANKISGAVNVGDGSAAVYTGNITADGSIELRSFVGVGAATVTENGNLIEIGLDASFAGEVNTASNIGTGDASVFAYKSGQDLAFRTIKALDPTELIITSDTSTIYFDVSIAAIADASLVGLTDTSINVTNLVDHTNLEYDASAGKWIETQNNWWDTSLATTATDIDGVPAGTVLEGDNLKEILYKILYAYQLPTITVGSDPVDGIYEKGLTATSFATIDVSYFASNSAYPLAKLNNLEITKTGAGTIFDSSLGLVDSSSGTYTDVTGITNWGGTTRTINYNVYVEDDQNNQGSSVFDQASFTFYYRQFWGMVDGNTNVGQVDSAMIKGLIDSRLAGESNLDATFDNSTGGFVKYLFAYPDTVAAPDNFGTLSQIVDQNDFDITDSWDTANEDVSIGDGAQANVRYRFYLLKNKVDTSIFDITFIF